MSALFPNINNNYYNNGYLNYQRNNNQFMNQSYMSIANQIMDNNNNNLYSNNYQMNNQQYGSNNFNYNQNNYNNYNQQNYYNNNYGNYINNNANNNFNRTFQNHNNNNYFNQLINNNYNPNQNQIQNINGNNINQGYYNNLNNNTNSQTNRNVLTNQNNYNITNYYGNKTIYNNPYRQQQVPKNQTNNNNLNNINNINNKANLQNNRVNNGINNPNINLNNNYNRINSINSSYLNPKTTVEDYSNKKVVLDFFIRARGLENVGATCYMNATLQCFYHVKALSENIINDKNINRNLKLTCCFKDLIEDLTGCKIRKKFFISRKLFKEDDSLKDSIKPVNFKNVLSEMNPLFKGVQANDSKDLILFLLETMDKELTLRNNRTNQMMIFNSNSLKDMEPQNFKKYHNSIFSEIFYGFQKSVMKCCRCNKELPTYSVFNFVIFPLEKIYNDLNNQNNMQQNNNMNNYYMNNNMNLFGNSNYNMYMYSNNYNIFRNNINNFDKFNAPTTINPISRMRINNINKQEKKKLSLNDCFKMNKNLENLTGENQIFCNNCRSKQNAIMYDEIHKAPNVLIIILNRGKGNSFECDIDFPMELNLSEHISNPASPKNYELIGVISHLGESSMEGHFIAYCKHFDEGWYLFNDAIVRQDPGKGELCK